MMVQCDYDGDGDGAVCLWCFDGDGGVTMTVCDRSQVVALLILSPARATVAATTSTLQHSAGTGEIMEWNATVILFIYFIRRKIIKYMGGNKKWMFLYTYTQGKMNYTKQK